jgi:hypothetical protein
VAVPLKQRQQLLARKMKKHAKVAAASAAPRDVKAAAMASAVMVAVVDATAAVANAAKARPAKSAHPAKVVVVVKAVAKDVLKVVTNCAKAKHVPHAANVLSEVNVLSALRAIVLPAKAAARVVARTAPKAAVMHSQS